MAEQEDVKHTPRKYHNAPQYHRGSRPYHNRTLYNLGVSDLREVLDRKRQERDHQDVEAHQPPPDPSFNYLKDRLRESGDDSTVKRPPYKESWHRGGRGQQRGRGGRKQAHLYVADIENPSNIKIEFSPSTGQHVYTLDESTTLPTIKHIPDQRPFYYRGRGGRGGRGGGRSYYYTRTINRNRNLDQGNTPTTIEDDVRQLQEAIETWDGINDGENSNDYHHNATNEQHSGETSNDEKEKLTEIASNDKVKITVQINENQEKNIQIKDDGTSETSEEAK